MYKNKNASYLFHPPPSPKSHFTNYTSVEYSRVHVYYLLYSLARLSCRDSSIFFRLLTIKNSRRPVFADRSMVFLV